MMCQNFELESLNSSWFLADKVKHRGLTKNNKAALNHECFAKTRNLDKAKLQTKLIKFVVCVFAAKNWGRSLMCILNNHEFFWIGMNTFTESSTVSSMTNAPKSSMSTSSTAATIIAWIRITTINVDCGDGYVILEVFSVTYQLSF